MDLSMYYLIDDNDNDNDKLEYGHGCSMKGSSW